MGNNKIWISLLALVFLLAGCGGGDEPSNQPSDNKEPSSPATASLPTISPAIPASSMTA